MTHPNFERYASCEYNAGHGLVHKAGHAVLLVALLMGSWRYLCNAKKRRENARSVPTPKRLQTWEGEGGRPDPEPEDEPAPDTASANSTGRTGL
jgi:hypothetical protein